MACGAAIVASDHAGIPELITAEVEGLLVPEHNESELSVAIARLLGDAELRSRLGAASRQRAVSSLDYRQLYGLLEGAMMECLNERRPAAPGGRA